MRLCIDVSHMTDEDRQRLQAQIDFCVRNGHPRPVLMITLHKGIPAPRGLPELYATMSADMASGKPEHALSAYPATWDGDRLFTSEVPDESEG